MGIKKPLRLGVVCETIYHNTLKFFNNQFLYSVN